MEFLFEIGLEEVPARMIAAAQTELQRRLLITLQRERLAVAGVAVKSFSTPRRLAVWVGNVAAQQEDVAEEVMGPAVKIAFKDGVPGPAALAFAKKAGVVVEELRIVKTPKGEYVTASSVKPGRGAADVIAEELPKELAAIYWAKTMYWRAGRPERFVRPVRWLLCLLGDAVVPVSFGGKTAGNTTYGHRVLHGDAPVKIAVPGDYEAVLEGAHVIVDLEARRHRIRKALDRVCRTIAPEEARLRWREDHALVDKLTHLTEWPSVIAGAFEGEYLTLPEEVLVTVMRDHQSYFAVEPATSAERSGTGEQVLAPYFLAVLNTETDAQGEAVIRHGNERVLRARFNDARFFWEFDQRVKLSERTALLEKVTFQKALGSYAAKTQRTRGVARDLAGLAAARGLAVDAGAVDTAAALAKTDLTCELVKEFTELQGEVGGLYARAQGYPAVVAHAIYDHYRPKSMEDAIPRTVEGQLLAIADKADTIAGMFSLGLEPTGSKDPFALRRAANGIVKVLAESSLPLTLGDVADAAASDEALRRRIEVFLAERLDFYLREAKGQTYDVVKAVLAAGANDARDAVSRAEAVTAVRGSADFTAVSAAFKRMKNILAQAQYDLPADETISVAVSTVAAGFDAEEILRLRYEVVRGRVEELAGRKLYVQALESIASMRPEVDAFFTDTMVMDPDPALRERRLMLLAVIVRSFSRIADFSEIVVAG